MAFDPYTFSGLDAPTVDQEFDPYDFSGVTKTAEAPAPSILEEYKAFKPPKQEQGFDPVAFTQLPSPRAVAPPPLKQPKEPALPDMTDEPDPLLKETPTGRLLKLAERGERRHNQPKFQTIIDVDWLTRFKETDPSLAPTHKELSERVADGTLSPDVGIMSLREHFVRKVPKDGSAASIIPKSQMDGDLADFYSIEIPKAFENDVQQEAFIRAGVLNPELNKPSQLRMTQALGKARKKGESATDYLIERLPFAGGGYEALQLAGVKAASDSIENGTGTDEDYAVLAKFQADLEKESEKGMVRKIIDTATAIPGFATEFLATGGAYTGVRVGVSKAGTELAKKMLKDRLKNELLKKGAEKAVSAGIGIASRVAGGAAQAAANPQLWVKNYAQRALEHDDEGFAEQMIKSFGDDAVEMLSERASGPLSRIPLPARIKALKAAVLSRWASKNPGATQKQLEELLKKAQWHGPIFESAEERIGEGLRAAGGIQDYPHKSLRDAWDQIVMEAGAFAGFGGAVKGAAMASDALPEIREGARQISVDTRVALDEIRKGNFREAWDAVNVPGVPLAEKQMIHARAREGIRVRGLGGLIEKGDPLRSTQDEVSQAMRQAGGGMPSVDPDRPPPIPGETVVDAQGNPLQIAPGPGEAPLDVDADNAGNIVPAPTDQQAVAPPVQASVADTPEVAAAKAALAPIVQAGGTVNPTGPDGKNTMTLTTPTGKTGLLRLSKEQQDALDAVRTVPEPAPQPSPEEVQAKADLQRQTDPGGQLAPHELTAYNGFLRQVIEKPETWVKKAQKPDWMMERALATGDVTLDQVNGVPTVSEAAKGRQPPQQAVATPVAAAKPSEAPGGTIAPKPLGTSVAAPKEAAVATGETGLTPEQRSEKAKMIRDMMESNRSLGKPIPQGWVNKLAELESGNQSQPGEIYSNIVEGHPQHEVIYKELSNLIPIKIRKASDLENKFAYAQALRDKLEKQIRGLEYQISVEKNPSKKKRLQSDLNNLGRERIVRDTLVETIIPELNRLKREALKNEEATAKLYRGVMSEGGKQKGYGTFALGKGVYSSRDKSFAKKYGNTVVEVSADEAWPKNPLVLTNLSGGAPSAFMDWALKTSGLKNARELNSKYPDPGELVREQGFDGVIAGDEIVKYPSPKQPSTPPSQPTTGAVVKAEPAKAPTLLEYAKSRLPKATADKITSESQVESFRAQWEKDFPPAKPAPSVPEYSSKLNADGTVDWQHRSSEELGGGVYKRSYPNLVEAGNDLADKFGRRFASSVEKELKLKGNASNRAKPAPAAVAKPVGNPNGALKSINENLIQKMRPKEHQASKSLLGVLFRVMAKHNPAFFKNLAVRFVDSKGMAAQYGAGLYDAKGIYDPNLRDGMHTLWLNTDKITTTKELREVVLHELGHFTGHSIEEYMVAARNEWKNLSQDKRDDVGNVYAKKFEKTVEELVASFPIATTIDEIAFQEWAAHQIELGLNKELARWINENRPVAGRIRDFVLKILSNKGFQSKDTAENEQLQKFINNAFKWGKTEPVAEPTAKPSEPVAKPPEAKGAPATGPPVTVLDSLHKGLPVKLPPGANAVSVTDMNGKTARVMVKDLTDLKGAGPFKKVIPLVVKMGTVRGAGGALAPQWEGAVKVKGEITVKEAGTVGESFGKLPTTEAKTTLSENVAEPTPKEPASSRAKSVAQLIADGEPVPSAKGYGKSKLLQDAGYRLNHETETWEKPAVPVGEKVQPVEKSGVKEAWQMTAEEYITAAKSGDNPIGAHSKPFWDRVQNIVIEIRKKNPKLNYDDVRQRVALEEAGKIIDYYKGQIKPSGVKAEPAPAPGVEAKGVVATPTETGWQETGRGRDVYNSDVATENAKDDLVVKAISSAPSYPRLLAAWRRFQKSLGRSGDTSAIEKTPWKLLDTSSGVMNAKSQMAKTLAMLEDAVFKESGLPRNERSSRFRGGTGIDWNKVKAATKPTLAAAPGELRSAAPTTEKIPTKDELKKMSIPLPEGGSSIQPHIALKWREDKTRDPGSWESLHEVSNYDDQFRIKEILGKGWEHSWKPSLHLLDKIKKDSPISVYRATPSDRTLILPGAYVTESRQYAQQHGLAQFGKDGKDFSVQKIEVKPSELMVYGDPHEMIYIPESLNKAHERMVDASKGLRSEATDVKERQLGKPGDTFSMGGRNVMFAAPGPVEMPVTAYHGTPHKIRKGDKIEFNPEKVGTGEGAAAYGWGIYTAENKAVAEEYAKNLSDSTRFPKTAPYLGMNGWAVDTNDGTQRFKTKEQAESFSNTKGNLYQVAIKAPADSFLDWDKNLGEQSEKVRKIMMQDLGRGYGATPTEKEFGNAYNGQSFYQFLARTETPVLKTVFKRSPSPQAASEYLASLGVKGIRYLDQGSRVYPPNEHGGAWEVVTMNKAHVFRSQAAAQKFYEAEKAKGTYNYVMFSADDIEITHENGQRVNAQDLVNEPQRQPVLAAAPGRVGQPIDDYEGKSPDVDWNATDLYGKWTQQSVAKHLGVPADKHVYRAMVSLSDLSPKRVEKMDAETTRKGESEIDQAYLDDAEAMLKKWTGPENQGFRRPEFEDWRDSLPWNPDDGYDKSDIETLAREMQARSESESYPEEDFSIKSKTGFPPIVVTRKGAKELVLEDGNHRTDIWTSQGYDVAPAWVNDEFARNKGKGILAAAPERVTPEQDRDYLDLAAKFEAGDKSVEPQLQKMVEDRAKQAGYGTTAFYGFSGNPFKVFDTGGKTAHFSSEHSVANSYAKGYQLTGKGEVKKFYLDLGKTADLRNPDDVNTLVENGVLIDDELLHDPERLAQEADSIRDAGFASITTEHQISMGIGDGTNEYIIFNPSQIKSADLITRTSQGRLILLSARFNPEKKSIMFAAPGKEAEDNLRKKSDPPIRSREAGTQDGNEAEMIGSAIDLQFSGYDTPIIPSAWNRLVKGQLLYKSTTDVLRKAGGSLSALADKIDEYLDMTADLVGRVTHPFNGVLRPLNRRARRLAFDEFEGYMTKREGMNKASAQDVGELDALYEGMSAPAKALVDEVKKLFVWTGSVNKQLNVHVLDVRTGQYRPIGDFGENYWPRILKKEYRDALRNPNSNPVLYEQIKATLKEQTGIEDEARLKQFIIENMKVETEKKFFANLEMARVGHLPNEFYEHRFDKVMPYFIASWAKRIGQIKAFGQALGGTQKDAFGTTMEGVMDPTTRNYLIDVRDTVYEKQRRQGFVKTMQWLRTFTTATKLGNVWTSLRNTSTIWINTIPEFGVGHVLPVLADLRHWGKQIENAEEAGVLRSDLIAGWAEASDFTEVQRKISEVALKASGFNMVETFTRSTAAAAALHWARWGLKKVEANPNSRSSLLFKAKLQKYGVNLADLQSEGMAGLDAEKKLMRSASNNTQFGYDMRQVALWMENPAAKFMFQFVKFGVQMLRRVEQDVLRPAFVGYKIEGKTVRDWRPLMLWMALSVGTGAGLYWLREFLFGKKRADATFEEIMNTADEKKLLAAKLIFQRLFHDAIYAGGLGVLGDWAANFEDFSSRMRSKSPLEPPGIGPFRNIWEKVIIRGMQQKGLTWRDMTDFAEGELPNAMYVESMLKNFGLPIADQIGMEWKGAKVQQARSDMRDIRLLGYRYAKEIGIEAPSSAKGGTYARTPKSPAYDRLQDALMIGDVATATKIRDEFIESIGDDKRARVMLMSAVRQRQPVKVGGLAKDVLKTDFESWVKRRVPSALPKLRTIDERYRQAAEKVGLWSMGEPLHWRPIKTTPLHIPVGNRRH